MKYIFVAILIFLCGTAIADSPTNCQHWKGRWQGEWQVGGVGKCTLNIKKVDQYCNVKIKYCGGGNSADEGKIENDKLQFECNRRTSGTCLFKMSSDRAELSANYSNPMGGSNNAVFKRKEAETDGE